MIPTMKLLLDGSLTPSEAMSPPSNRPDEAAPITVYCYHHQLLHENRPLARGECLWPHPAAESAPSADCCLTMLPDGGDLHAGQDPARSASLRQQVSLWSAGQVGCVSARAAGATRFQLPLTVHGRYPDEDGVPASVSEICWSDDAPPINGG